MSKTKVKKIVNITSRHNVGVELSNGNTVFLRPKQALEDVEINNMHRIKDMVRVEEEEIKEDLTEVKPGRNENIVNLTEIKPPKHKRGRKIYG